MGKLMVELPDDIHQTLKRKAALNNKTMRQIVMELLDRYLSQSQEEKAKSLQETGFCGTWEDKRKAEEIISDIKKHRGWFQFQKEKGLDE